MSGEIRLIRYSEILNSPELLAEYAAECSISEIGKTAPNPKTYAALEQTGNLRCFAAYEDGKLIGFASVLLSTLPHYDKKVAIVESIFAAKDSGCGRDLRSIVKAHAREAGCGVVLYSAPSGGRFERLLEKDKTCRKTNSVFCESLN